MSKTLLPEIVSEFIRSNRIMVLSTVSPDNTPESALVYYGWDGQLTMYCCTYNKSRKFHNIQTNNKVSIVIGQEIKAVVLQVEGTAKIIHDKLQKAEVMDKYARKATENQESIYFPPLLSLTVDSPMEFLEITIDWFKFSTFESHFPNILEGKPNDWHELPIK